MNTGKLMSRIVPTGLSALLLASCSGYSSNPARSNEQVIESSAQRWDKLSIAGELSGGRFDKTSVLQVDKQKKEIVLSLPMAANAYIDGTQATLSLSKIPGASLQLDPIEGGGSVLTLHVPLSILVNPDEFATPAKLPNGKDLPYAPGGKLPAETLALSEFTTMSATIYLGKNVVGLYVTLPLNPLSEIDNPIQSADALKVWGSLHTYPASCRSCKDGGLYSSIRIPADIAQTIEENL